MTVPGLVWRHVIINTLRTWLHGDARGFRNRKHRIHSSGDYRNPPPPGEHAGLPPLPLPGNVWAAGGTYKQVKDRPHLHAATEYVLYDQGITAWT